MYSLTEPLAWLAQSCSDTEWNSLKVLDEENFYKNDTF